tara:strand:+ start:1382 stop:1639 length:258 start_codon:yes stop_codon:yes gene_type:complete
MLLKVANLNLGKYNMKTYKTLTSSGVKEKKAIIDWDNLSKEEGQYCKEIYAFCKANYPDDGLLQGEYRAIGIFQEYFKSGKKLWI